MKQTEYILLYMGKLLEFIRTYFLDLLNNQPGKYDTAYASL